MRLSANLGFLFQELPFLDRFAAAAAAGFKGVEFMFPHGVDAEEITRRLDRFGLELVLFNLPAGDWAAGERGIAGLPGRTQEFRDGVEASLQLAKITGTRRLNALTGIPPAGSDDETVAGTLIDNLRYAAARLDTAGVGLLIEPINSRIDMPGFWLDTPAKAVDIVGRVGHRNLALQYDVYHAQIMDTDPLTELFALLSCIGHIQIADAPGRHQPGTGQIDFPALFSRLDASTYQGWVGCEFRPQGTMAEALSWAVPWLAEAPLPAHLA